MRPPALLWLLLLRLGAAAPPADSPSQLPAPQNPTIHLYNAKQALSWEPVSLSNETGPVVYQVQFKFPASKWSDVDGNPTKPVKVNCSKITKTECNFTPTSLSKGFVSYFNVSLRVRAELQDRTSPWALVPWFQRYLNVTIGPPENIWVTPEEGSLIIRLSPPFDVLSSEATFLYYVHYWEKAGERQVRGPFRSNFIVLKDLKPLKVYCLQVQAQLSWKYSPVPRSGHLSNISCHETTADASTKLQQAALIAVGTFLSLVGLAGACFFLILKYRVLIKHWFQSPPGIPVQIEEYLKDPAQPILEALDSDSSPKEDVWDSVSVVSLPQKA